MAVVVERSAEAPVAGLLPSDCFEPVVASLRAGDQVCAIGGVSLSRAPRTVRQLRVLATPGRIRVEFADGTGVEADATDMVGLLPPF